MSSGTVYRRTNRVLDRDAVAVDLVLVGVKGFAVLALNKVVSASERSRPDDERESSKSHCPERLIGGGAATAAQR